MASANLVEIPGGLNHAINLGHREVVQGIGDCLEIQTDVKNTGNTKFYEEAFEDNIYENVANTEDASKYGNDMIGV